MNIHLFRMANARDYIFELTFFRHGVELNLYHTSKLDNNGDPPQDILNLRDAVENYIHSLRCETCKTSGLQLLEWIISGATDDDLADWCCKQYRDYYKREGQSFTSKSPRDCALGVLRDIYICTDCINLHMAACEGCV